MAEEGLTLESACWRSWPAPRLNLIIHIPTFKSISKSTKRSLMISTAEKILILAECLTD